jgi:uncharacterized protein (TIGR00255 family)
MGALSGMTGFGRSEGSCQAVSWTWEIRSVNGKGLEARFRFPAGYERLEAKARELAKARFARGNIQAGLTLRREKSAEQLRVDSDRLDQLVEAAIPYVEAGRVALPTFDGLLSVRGVLDFEDAPVEIDQEVEDTAILQSLEAGLDDLRTARLAEGTALHDILSAHVDTIESLTREAAGTAALRSDAIRDRIAAKYAELLPEGLPEDRLAIEAAALAIKMDVREELDRLVAHVGSARELLVAGSPTGRKLDFLSQEFNREANTLCSKSADSTLTRIGLAMKNAVDQLREQVQNVE